MNYNDTENYGPNAFLVKQLVRRIREASREEMEELRIAAVAANSTVRLAARCAARDITWNASRYRARKATEHIIKFTVQHATENADRFGAEDAVKDAANALIVKDLMNLAQFECLVEPVVKTFGRFWEEKA